MPVGPFASFSVLEVALFLGVALLLFPALWVRKLEVGSTSVFLLLLLPLIVAECSILWSQDLNATVKAVIIWSEAVVAYLVVVNLFKRCYARIVMKSLASFVLVSFVIAILAIARVPGFQPQIPPEMVLGSPEHAAFILSFYARLSHPFMGLSNSYATVLSFFVMPFFAWGWITGNKRFFWTSFFTFTAVVLTISRGVFAATVVSCVLFLLQRRLARAIPYFILAFVMMGAVFYGYYTLVPAVHSTLLTRASGENVDIRFHKAHIGLQKIAQRPFIGYGADVVAGGEKDLQGGVHNTFLQQILNFGIFFGWIVNGVLMLLAWQFWRWPGSNDCRLLAKAVAFSIVGQMIAFASQTSFEGSLLRVLFYFSIGSAVAFLNAYAAEEQYRKPTGLVMDN